MKLSIKRRLLLTITGIFFASTIFVGFFDYRSQKKQLQESLKDMAKTECVLFQSILSADAEGLARAQVGLTRLDLLLKPFAEKNKNALLAASTPLLKELGEKHDITHMYFIEPDGTVFLRVHKPEQFGDKLDRATFKRAAETGKPASGLEMGRIFFSLRCVHLVSYQGKTIGFIEIAEEIDHVFEQMKAITGNDVSLFLAEDYLKKYHVAFPTEKKFDGFSVLYPTDLKTTLRLAGKLKDTVRKGFDGYTFSFVDVGGVKHAVGMGPVKDAFGNTAGILLSHRDVSPLYSAMWKGIIAGDAIFVAIFLVSIALLYLSLRKSLALFNALRQHIVTVTKTWDLSRRLEVNTNDEIGELVTDFNLMKEEIKTLNESLALRAEELTAANQELEAFNYTVSHDLRKPLTIINGYCQAIMEMCDTSLDEECKNYLGEIYNGTLRMNQLIEALLKFSVMARSELLLEPVDLSGIAKTVAAELRQTEPEREVRFEIAEGITVNGDRNLLQVVMENLLGNAWKYTGRREEAVIEFGKTTVAGEPACFVRDNGAGFDMAQSERLFAPFQRLPGTDEFKGHGIGLATVARIIQRHGGRVWAEGEPDKGATFYFTLRD